MMLVLMLVPAVAVPADSLCHPNGCKSRANGYCTTWQGITALCDALTNTGASQDGSVTLRVAGIEAIGQASLAAAVPGTPSGSTSEIPAGSIMQVTMTTRWTGNASRSTPVMVAYEFHTDGFDWLSPPGTVPTGSDPTPDSEIPPSNRTAPKHAVYTFELTDLTASTTFSWALRVRAGHEGRASLPVTLLLIEGNNAERADGRMGFQVVPASGSTEVVEPASGDSGPWPFLLAGLALGVVAGFLVARFRTRAQGPGKL